MLIAPEPPLLTVEPPGSNTVLSPPPWPLRVLPTLPVIDGKNAARAPRTSASAWRNCATGLGQGLVGTFQVHLQVVQGLVAVQLPPGAALEHVARLGAAPAFGFLEFGGHRQVRSLVVGADGAAAEGGDQGQGKQRGVCFIGVSPAHRPCVRRVSG